MLLQNARMGTQMILSEEKQSENLETASEAKKIEWGSKLAEHYRVRHSNAWWL